MNSANSAKEYLERLRKKYSPIASPALEPQWEQLFQSIDERNSALWHGLRDTLEPFNQEMRHLWVGSLWTNNPNMMVCRPPSGNGMLIVIDHSFSMLIQNLIAAMLSFSPSVQKMLENQPGFTSQILFNTVQSIRNIGSNSNETMHYLIEAYKKSNTLPKEVLQKVKQLKEYCLMFCIMHEFSHAVLGHLEQARSVKLKGIERLAFRRDLELEADEQALIGLFQYLEKSSAIDGAWMTPDIIFGILNFIEQIRGQPEERYSDHPHAATRRNQYYKILGNNLWEAIEEPELRAEAEGCYSWYVEVAAFAVSKFDIKRK